MSISRRSALSILGLAGPATGLAVEHALAEEPANINLRTADDYRPQHFANALRRLADEIESGGVRAQRLNISAELARGDIIIQRLVFEFDIKDVG